MASSDYFRDVITLNGLLMKFSNFHASIVAGDNSVEINLFPVLEFSCSFQRVKPVLTCLVSSHSLWLYKLYFQSVGKSLTFRGTVNEARELMKSHKCSDPVCSSQLWKVSPIQSGTNINIPSTWQFLKYFMFLID